MKYTLTGKDVVIFLIHVVNILHFTFCSSLKKSMDVWSRVYCLWLSCFVYQLFLLLGVVPFYHGTEWFWETPAVLQQVNPALITFEKIIYLMLLLLLLKLTFIYADCYCSCLVNFMHKCINVNLPRLNLLQCSIVMVMVRDHL